MSTPAAPRTPTTQADAGGVALDSPLCGFVRIEFDLQITAHCGRVFLEHLPGKRVLEFKTVVRHRESLALACEL